MNFSVTGLLSVLEVGDVLSVGVVSELLEVLGVAATPELFELLPQAAVTAIMHSASIAMNHNFPLTILFPPQFIFLIAFTFLLLIRLPFSSI
jgi:hypothetical protein